MNFLCFVILVLFFYAGNKQHTFIETDAVRYVYQPIDNLFLLLLTNKASNIVEDLETLRMLSKGARYYERVNGLVLVILCTCSTRNVLSAQVKLRDSLNPVCSLFTSTFM